MKQKRYIFLLFIIFLLSIHLKAQYNDTFSYGNSLNSSKWKGDLTSFEIRNGSLHLNNLKAEGSNIKSYISTFSQSAYPAQWEGDFKITTQPTSGNLIRYYLIASQSNLTHDLNGYFVEIGGTKKTVRLVKQIGMRYTTLVYAKDNVLDMSTYSAFNKNKIDIHIKVTRSNNGLWTLAYKLSFQTHLKVLASKIDRMYKRSSYSGVYIRYSKTHAKDYWIDNLKVTGKWAYDTDPDNPDHPYTNCKRHDLVINEILFDPNPQVDLPNEEYIELYNRKETPFYSDKCYIQVGSTVKRVDRLSIDPCSYCMLKGKDIPNLRNTGNVIALLAGDSSTVITWSKYSPDWILSSEKRDGGWALEKMDVSNLDQSKENWSVSEDLRGGTPGKINSIARSNPDKRKCDVLKWRILGQDTLELFFNKELNVISVFKNTTFHLDHNLIRSIELEPIQHKKVRLILSGLLVEDKLSIIDLYDISGYSMCAILSIEQPEPPTKGSIVINEILPQEEERGEEFVELYNDSEHAIDISRLGIALIKGSILQKVYPISVDGGVLIAHGYAVISENIKLLNRLHPIENTSMKIETLLPSFGDEEGHIVLVEHRSAILDRVDYSSINYPVQLKSHEGMSLERKNPQCQLWSCASCTVEYATPGYLNSNYVDRIKNAECSSHFGLKRKHFSPNQDGYEDRAQLEYNLPQGNYVVSIHIMNMNGVEKYLWMDNQVVSGSGYLEWDGRDKGACLLPSGPYVLLIECVNSHQEIKEKKIVVLL